RGRAATVVAHVVLSRPAGLSADLLDAFAGIDGLLLGVALLAVFIILILVYRSFLLPIAVLSTSLFALCAALLTVWWFAKWDLLLLNGQTQGILFILVIGAATDYSLLFVARYRSSCGYKPTAGRQPSAPSRERLNPSSPQEAPSSPASCAFCSATSNQTAHSVRSPPSGSSSRCSRP